MARLEKQTETFTSFDPFVPSADLYWEVSCLPLGRHDSGWLRRSSSVLVRCEFDVFLIFATFFFNACCSTGIFRVLKRTGDKRREEK